MITLQCGEYVAWILKERGGSCIRLAAYGIEALRTPDRMEAYSKENPFLFGTPFLFPPNRIENGSFQFEGRAYCFPINEPSTGCFLHGTLHETPFTTISQSETSVTLEYSAKKYEYLGFPHGFTITLDTSLSEHGLRQRVTCHNNSLQNMPIGLGFHTTFNALLTEHSKPEDMRLKLSVQEEYLRDARTFLPNGSILRKDAFLQALQRNECVPCAQPISRLYKMGTPSVMVLEDTKAHARVVYTAGEGYHYWMVFGGGQWDYICVEPQTWLTNAPNSPFPLDDTGFDFIVPGDCRSYETTIAIEPV